VQVIDEAEQAALGEARGDAFAESGDRVDDVIRIEREAAATRHAPNVFRGHSHIDFAVTASPIRGRRRSFRSRDERVLAPRVWRAGARTRKPWRLISSRGVMQSDRG
jgi:hypothetical protein